MDELSYRPGGRVVLRAYDANWPIAFDEAARELVAQLGDVVLALHHVGSTAINGIVAKPVIDILAVVADLGELDQRAGVLATMGYEARGEFGIPHRRYFCRNSAAGARTRQVHAFATGHPEIDRMLLFRDYLRANPAVAQEYETLKCQLAARVGDDIEAYARGKSAFVNEVLSAAGTRPGAFRAPGHAV